MIINRLLLPKPCILSSYNTQKSNINLVPTGTIFIRNLETIGFFFVLTNGTGNLEAEHNLEVTASSRCYGRRWCKHEVWSKIDVKKLLASQLISAKN